MKISLLDKICFLLIMLSSLILVVLLGLLVFVEINDNWSKMMAVDILVLIISCKLLGMDSTDYV